MAFISWHGARPIGLGSRVAGRASRILRGAMHVAARTEEVERLSAMSDAELARMGLARGDIARHVFRDRLVV